LDLRRGERPLRRVGGELAGRGGDRNGERLGGARQLVLNLALDVDVGIELIDRVGGERLLNIGVGEDLVCRVLELTSTSDASTISDQTQKR
jgi:hypothetical protein